MLSSQAWSSVGKIVIRIWRNRNVIILFFIFPLIIFYPHVSKVLVMYRKLYTDLINVWPSNIHLPIRAPLAWQSWLLHGRSECLTHHSLLCPDQWPVSPFAFKSWVTDGVSQKVQYSLCVYDSVFKHGWCKAAIQASVSKTQGRRFSLPISCGPFLTGVCTAPNWCHFKDNTSEMRIFRTGPLIVFSSPSSLLPPAAKRLVNT